MVVQHNLRAMNSNRMLGLTASSQSKSTEKLSSGYKINRAADDAAGLSISEKMRKQIRGLSQASLNASDGISAVQTAEGALNEVQDMLQRMNELAVKASNGTMSEDDRGYIQDEIEQLIDEIDRVAETTKFNETYLLKGDASVSDDEKDIKFSYNTAEVLTKELMYLKDGTIHTVAKGDYRSALDDNIKYYEANTELSKVGVKCTSTFASTNFVNTVTVINRDDLYRYDSTVQDYVSVNKGDKYIATESYYTVSSGNGVHTASKVTTGHTTAYYEVAQAGKGKVWDSKGNELAVGEKFATASVANYYTSVADQIFDPTKAVDIDECVMEDEAQFVDRDGNEIAANGLYRYLDDDGKLLKQGELFFKSGGTVDQDDIDEYITTSKFDRGALTLSLHVGADATSDNQITIDIQAMSSARLGIDSVDVSGANNEGALNAIETVKEAIQMISTQRSALGAVQNRLEHTIANLDNVVENTTAAESQIRDTDMATEMVKYSNNNILAQAGQAMLAQANQANQGVLSILG